MVNAIAKGCIVLALCAGGLTSAAQASSLGSIDLDFQGMGDRSRVVLNYSGSNGPTLTDRVAWAGELNYFVNAASGPASFVANQQITTFCIDIWESADSGEADVFNLQGGPVSNGVAMMGADRAGLIDSLYNVAGYDVSTQFGGGFSGPDSDKTAGAFQLAIWEIVAEDDLDSSAADFALSGLDVSAGHFTVSADTGGGYVDGTLEMAQQMLMDAWNSWSPGMETSLLTAAGNGLQDVIIVVPLPQPVLMSALGLLGVFVLRRRLMPH